MGRRLAAEGISEYEASYRDKLHRALVVGSVVGVLVSRLLLKSCALELACALVFVGVELLPALVPFGAASRWLWESRHVHTLVELYEASVYNGLWDLEQLGPVLLLLALAGCCVSRARRMKRQGAPAPGARSKASGTGMWPMGAELAEVVVAGASPGGRGRSVKDQ